MCRPFAPDPMPPVPAPLPIDAVLPELAQALASGRNAVLQAEPGAGKTTRVPLALLDATWLEGRRIIMLEPRRLAARNAAHYMARQRGEAVGDTVGYRVRLDTKVGPRTRIEVVTEGILTRRLQHDPELADVGLVIFDEFHERNLPADLGLALCLDVQQALRADLRILVMSATLEGMPIAKLLGDAPVIESRGRAYPVAVHYAPNPNRTPGRDALTQHVASTVVRALREEGGSALVFLPGVAEIHAVERALRERALGSDVLLAPLYGDLPLADQERAIEPALTGQRKVVLATAIAETSLTIEGVRMVIDAGLTRAPRFDPQSGMTRLHTTRVSQASSIQRCGRAGRTEPGLCYRLWSEGEQRALVPHDKPEILEADLAPLVLELAAWGSSDPTQLRWVDAPPSAAYAQGRDLLLRLGALDDAGRVTPHGRQMAELGAHPRLAHMMLKGKAEGVGALACELAALLSERDILREADRDADLHTRLALLRSSHGGPGARVKQTAQQWQRHLHVEPQRNALADAHYGRLVAYAYPDRIAQHRPGPEPRYRLANGRGAFFATPQSLAAQDYLVVAQLDGAEREARIFLAATITREEILEAFADQITRSDVIAWDGAEQAVLARRRTQLQELILSDEALNKPDPQRVGAALLQGIATTGLDCLPWTKAARTWCERVQFLHRVAPNDWPDVSDAGLRACLADWLGPYLNGMSRLSHLPRVDLHAALTAQLNWEQQRALERLAPTHWQVPTGNRIPIDYSGPTPVLAVRLQEMFGATETPRIADGRVALLLHLLSPAHRPVQVTQDLKGFWANTYHDVKRDLKGRYPKHAWPDDPLTAAPTHRARPRSAK